MSLTEDDKKWISGMIEAQISSVNDHMEERIERVNQRIEERIERVYERIERVETSLLTEFHKWASPLEMRMRSHSAAMRALDLELESLNERVTS